MPTVYATTAARGVFSGIHRCTIPAMSGPTPASANIAPSAASVCGSTAAQLDRVHETARFNDRRGSRRSQHHDANDQGDHGCHAERDQRDLFRIDEWRAVHHDVLERERAQQRHGGNGQRRNEQPVSPRRGARLTLGARRSFRRRATELSDGHDEHHRDHDQTVEQIRKVRSGEKRDGVESPECRVVVSLRARACRAGSRWRCPPA